MSFYKMLPWEAKNYGGHNTGILNSQGELIANIYITDTGETEFYINTIIDSVNNADELESRNNELSSSIVAIYSIIQNTAPKEVRKIVDLILKEQNIIIKKVNE